MENVTKAQFEEYKLYSKEIAEMRDKRLEEKFYELRQYLDDKFTIILSELRDTASIVSKHETRIKALELDNMKIKWTKKMVVVISTGLTTFIGIIFTILNYLLDRIQ